MSDNAIEEKDGRFNSLMNNLHSIVYSRKNNKDWEIEYINHGCLTVTGYSHKEFMNDRYLLGKLILTEDKKQVRNTIQDALKNSEPFDVHYRIHHKKGNIKYVRELGEGVFAKNNKMVALEGFITDITAQKKIEQELETNHIRSKAILQALPDILFVIDKEGVYIDVHAQDPSLLGFTKSNLVGKSIHEALPKQVSDRIMKVLGETEIDGKIKTLEFTLPILDELKYFEARVVAKENGNFLMITRDVTEQKKLEQELKKSEAKNKSILEESKKQLEEYTKALEQKVLERTDELKNTVQELVESNLSLEDQIEETKAAERRALENQSMFTAIARHFPQGIIVVVDSDFSIAYIEGEELKVNGLDKFLFEGVRINEIKAFSEKRRSRIIEDIQKTLTGKHLSFEIEYQNKSYSVHSTPLFDEAKKVTRALFVYTDISEQKNKENQIQRSLEKEQELNELKSRFISTASHEFRTPLSAILSSASLIEKQNEQGKEETRIKHVGTIRSNVKNLVVILNDFLSLSKLEEGKVVAQSEHFDLVAFTKKLIEEIEPNKKVGQKITLSTNEVSMLVFLDPKLLSHIITNLLSNAIKYSDGHKKIEAAITRKGTFVIIAIKDQGIGIPVEDQKNLFNRFYRAENVQNIEGTGLGLNIVKQYTELMGGSVALKSEVQKGTTFFVEFPINIK